MNDHMQLSWKTPEELVCIGYIQSRVVMMNEAHNGLARCRRTREIGTKVLPIAHTSGVRYLALEALSPEITVTANTTRQLPDVSGGYLAQQDMRTLIQSALDLGWTLIHYEDDGLTWLQNKYADSVPRELANEGTGAVYKKYQADFLSDAYTNYRELQQAKNIINFLATVPDTTKLLIWCGNGHHGKAPSENWIPMGYQFTVLSGITPFCIDQNITVKFEATYSPYIQEVLDALTDDLQQQHRTAGFLVHEAPPVVQGWGHVDAIILSLDNQMIED